MSANPADNTPRVLDGHVNAFAQVGDQMIVGGKFSQVKSGGDLYARSNLFSFDIATGQISTTFAPVAHGEVFDLQVTPSHAYVVVAGAFSSIDSTPSTSRVAAISASTGAVLTSFEAPAFNDTIRDIGYSRGSYYLTGDFSKAGGVTRTGLATLANTGHLTNRARIQITGTATGRPGASKVRSADISPNGRWMAIAGNFSAVSGQRRPQIALLRLTASTTRVSPWSTSAYAAECQKNFNTYLRDVAFSPDSRFFIAGDHWRPQGLPAERT